MKRKLLRKLIAMLMIFNLITGIAGYGSWGSLRAYAEDVSSAPLVNDVTVRNYITGIDDKIIVSNLIPGDVVKVYNAESGGDLLGSATTQGNTATVTNFLNGQLGPNAGTVYVSKTSINMSESSRTAVSYTAEPVPWEIYSHTGNWGENYQYSILPKSISNRYTFSSLPLSGANAAKDIYPAYPNSDDDVSHNINNNKHIIIKQNGQRVTFYGYGMPSYKDFTFLPTTDTSSRDISFDIDLSTVSFHTMEGAGFLFNIKKNGSGNLDGYALLIVGEVDTNFSEDISKRNINLYKLTNVSPEALKQGNASTTSSSVTTDSILDISGVSKVVFSSDSSPKNGDNSLVYPQGRTPLTSKNVHYMKIQVSQTELIVQDSPSGADGSYSTIMDYKGLTGTGANGVGLIASNLQHGCSILSSLTFNNVVIQGSTWPIVDLTASSATSQGKINLSYTAPLNAEVVVIQKSTDGVNFTNASTETPVSPTDNSVTVTGLTNGTSYTFRVLVGGGINEGISNTAKATPTGAYAAPAAADDIVTVSANSGATIVPVLANDTSSDGGTLSVASVGAAVYGTVDLTAGVVKYTPNAGYSGPDSFTYTIIDGHGGTASATVHITVLDSNHVPVIPDYNITTGKGQTVTGQVYATDVDGDNITYSKGSNPLHGSVTVTSSVYGNYSYTPNPGYIGNDMFTVIANDGKGGMATSIVNIYVLDTNRAPVAVNDTYSVTGGQTLSITAPGILSNDTDADNDNLTAVSISSISDTSKGLLTANADGSFTYAANEAASGSVTFTYKANDGMTDSSNTATVTINLTPLKKDLSGTIKDGSTKNPIAGATVILKDLSGKELGTYTTGADGTYLFPQVVANRYNIEVQQNGYSSSHREASVSKAADIADGSEDGKVTNDFELVKYKISLAANPSSILGDGSSYSDLTAIVVDSNGNPQSGVTVVFAAPDATYGTFSNGSSTITALTSEDGKAITRYTSKAMGGTEAKVVPITASVDDNTKDLHASDKIFITFSPGAIVGVVTDNSGNPVANAIIEVKKDFDNDGIVDFYGVQVTGADGKYSIAIPEGNVQYDVAITKTITINNVPTEVTFTQKSNVTAALDGSGQTFDSNKTASGIILVKDQHGIVGPLSNNTGYSVDIVDSTGNTVGSNIGVDSNGVFNKDVGTGTYTVLVKHQIELPDHSIDYIVVGKSTVTVNDNGQVNISEMELIDPYGTVTDDSSGSAIAGVNIVLHYTDGTIVPLPSITGFPPADNANPQSSDASGKYAFMVFPNKDYYITATKDGYDDFTSGIIHVGTEIVKYDFQMHKKTTGSGGGSIVIPVVKPGDPVDLATLIQSSKMKALEGDTVSFTITYANKTSSDADGIFVKAIIPDSMSFVDASDNGVLTGNEIKWSLGSLKGNTRGTLTFRLKVNSMNVGENYATVTSEIGSDKVTSLINPEDDTSIIKLLLYSDKFEHMHKRYIKGYPDGEVKPEKYITRAEVAAIFARTLDLKNDVQHVKLFKDVDTDYWGAEYIEAVAKKGIFIGYEDNTFQPDKPITRAELATAIARYLGIAKEKKIDSIIKLSQFSDTSNHWAEASIEEIFRFGIVSGYGDNSFKPDQQLTREETFKMINRMLYRGPLTAVEPSYPDNNKDNWSFGDVEETTRTHAFKLNEDGSETMINYIPEPLW